MIWNEEAECMSREDKEELQLALFQKQVKTVYEKVPFYKKKFDDAGFHPDDLKTLDDVKKIPFTTKDDLRSAYPFGLFAVPEDEIIELPLATTSMSGENVPEEPYGWPVEPKTVLSKIHTDTDCSQVVLESTTVPRQQAQWCFQCLQEILQDK